MPPEHPSDAEAREGRLSVAVVSRGRPLRLRWLLNALAEQDLGAAWEVVVVHDGQDATIASLLSENPAGLVNLRGVVAPGSAGLSARRNLAWRTGVNPTVIFCDDDSRPADGWAERALEWSSRTDTALVEGRTTSDPTEFGLGVAPTASRWASDPPAELTPSSNLLCSRKLLDDTGGFDEDLPGELIAGSLLAARAGRAGYQLVPDADLLVYSAVHPFAPRTRLARLLRDRQLVVAERRYPELRSLTADRARARGVTAGLRRLIAATALVAPPSGAAHQGR